MYSEKNFLWGRIMALCVSFAVLFCVFCAKVNASDENGDDITVSGTRTTDDAVYVYIRGIGDADDVTAQIGSEYCDNIEVIKMGDGKIRIRTLIILDNSLSTSNPWGKEAISLMDSLVKDHAENEEFKIVTYAQGLTELTSYTSDYLTLQSVISGIKYEKQESYITDILYNLLDGVIKEKEDIFYRFIIIADGADNNEITYTQTELRDLMKIAGVPVHTIGIDTGTNSKELETLFSYARQTNGGYWRIKKGDSPDTVESAIENDLNMVCIKLLPDRSMMDGSNKEARITMKAGGNNVDLRATLQMPFASGPAPTETPTETIVPTEPERQTEGVIPTVASEEPPVKENSKISMYIIIALSLLIVAGLIVLIAYIIKNKKKKEEDKNKWNYLPESDDDGEKTVLLGSQEDDGDHTMMLWNKSDTAPSAYVILTALDNSARVFRVPIISSIVIGRKAPADIVLDFDRAVSGKHCMISKRGNQYFIKDMGSANKTFYNDEEVVNETLLEDGGIIAMGKGKYRFSSEE